MIKLTKSAVPKVLEENAEAWTAAITRHFAGGMIPSEAEKTRYRHPDIKVALVAETAGKCAYCESKLRHIAYGDVEHIVPKSIAIEKTFEWSNLTLACDVCNTNKGRHFGNHEDLVDPYVAEPTDHLVFFGANILPTPGSGPGMATESTLVLNRIELLERRSERLASLNRLLYLLVEVGDENKKSILRRDLEVNEVAGDKEYAGMARAFVKESLRRIDDVTAGSGG